MTKEFEQPASPEKPKAYISFGGGGHDGEYMLNLEDCDHRSFIPQSLADQISAELGGEWDVSNRGTRIEVYYVDEYGHRDDEKVTAAIRKALGSQYDIEIIK
ncbi:hypothetical protein HQ571_03515 [Candidatus Kuenenbacteria bacterium]|nr:hypothetical protein [Candidatus Kuenenbacteria bacterium]